MSDGNDTPAPAATENTMLIDLPNSDTKVSIDLTQIPAEVRMELLQSKVKAYVLNRVTTEDARVKKANAAFDAYEAAQAVDVMQTAVPKPEGERVVADLIKTAVAARDALYTGKLRGRGGEPKERKSADPLVTAVTGVVVRELFTKNKAINPAYRYPDAVKEVGGDGIAYLNAKIEERIAAGGDEKALRKYMEDKYLAPARIMLGITKPKSLGDMDSLLG